jgi:DNA-binding Lrp family transcriptional regulator
MARKRSFQVMLSHRERKTIMRFQKRTSSVNARTRCAILLAADTSKGRSEKTYREIASASGASEATVITTLKEFLTDGFTKMITPKRNPASDISRLKVTGDVEAKIIATACCAAPKGYVRWTLNLLYNQMMVVLEDISISRSTIGRILMKNDLRPHLNDYWGIPPEEDAEFVANMEDILDVYQKPYDPKYPLWCMDEKPYQILGEAREPLPMRPGDLAKVDSEYVRNGTVSIFCFIQPHTGKLLHSVEPTRTAVDWAEKIKYLVDEVEPDAEKIILVMDNLNTHNISSLYKAFRPEEARRIAKKLEVHYTPRHGSWLDIAEIGINIMTRECLDRRIPSIEALKEELKAWNDEYDKDPSPVNWQFQTTDSRIKLKRLYPDIEKYRKDRDERRTAKLEKK